MKRLASVIVLLVCSISIASAAQAQLHIMPGYQSGDHLGDDLITFARKTETNFNTVFSGQYTLSDPDTFRAGIVGATHVNTLANLLSLSGAAQTNIVVVLGRTTRGDKGSGVFYWDPTSTASTNLGTCFSAVGSWSTGRWHRLVAGPLEPTMFGAAVDNSTDDYIATQACLDTAGAGAEMRLSDGTSYISQPLVPARYQTIKGSGPNPLETYTTTLRFAGDAFRHLHDWGDDDYDFLKLEGVALLGSGYSGTRTGTALRLSSSHQIRVERCSIRFFDVAIEGTNCWEAVIFQTHIANNRIGILATELVTDWTVDNCTIDHNVYPFKIETTHPQNVQTIRFKSCSIQYNEQPMDFNGGLECSVDGRTHFEGNQNGNIRIGSVTNECKNFTSEGNHDEWSDAAAGGWTNVFGPYSVEIINGRSIRIGDHHHSGATDDSTKRRTAFIRVHSGSSDISLYGTSDILTPYAISDVRLNQTNPNRNLIPNPLMLRDEKNPNNYPYAWITDFPHTNDFVGLSQIVPGVVGYTYSATLTNNSSFRQFDWARPVGGGLTNDNYTYDYALDVGKRYTYTTLLKGPIGSRVQLHFVDRNWWDGGSNSLTDTYNTITNTGDYQWVVARYECDAATKTEPYLWTKLIDTGVVTSIEIGEVSFQEGNGVGGVSWLDGVRFNNSTGQIKFSSDTPTDNGTTGERRWNDYKVRTDVDGWVCATAPTEWRPFGGQNVNGGTNGYVGVGMGTNTPTAQLHVYAADAFGGITLDGPNNPLINIKWNGTNKVFFGPVTGTAAYFSDAVADDVALRYEGNGLLIGPGGGAASHFKFYTSATTNETGLYLWDVAAGSLKQVTVDTNRFLKLAP